MICAKTPEGLPAIASLKRISQGLAALDAMLCEAWERGPRGGKGVPEGGKPRQPARAIAKKRLA